MGKQEITVQKENILNAYKQASKEQNGLDPRQVNIENYDDKGKLQEKLQTFTK